MKKINKFKLIKLSIEDEFIFKYGNCNGNWLYIPELKKGNKFYYAIKLDDEIIKSGDIIENNLPDYCTPDYKKPIKKYEFIDYYEAKYCSIKKAIDIISKNNNIVNRIEIINDLIEKSIKFNNEKIELITEKLINDNTFKKLENKLGCLLYSICEENNITLECQKYINYDENKKYFIDYYIPEINLAIEMDEYYHKFNKENDKYREDNIVEYLECRFYRIKENKKNKLNFEEIKKDLSIYIKYLCIKLL